MRTLRCVNVEGSPMASLFCTRAVCKLPQGEDPALLSKIDRTAAWLKDDYDVGRGHAMALFGVLKNGAMISDKYVDSGTTHSDASTELRLDGIDRR